MTASRPLHRVTSLDELCEVLANAPEETSYDVGVHDIQSDYAARWGLPVAHGEIDWTSLPTFGGERPLSLKLVWSWDATRLLVGTCADDLRLVPREEVGLWGMIT